MSKSRYIFGVIYNLNTRKIKLKKFNIKYEMSFLLKNEKFIILNDTYKRQLVILKIENKKVISIKKSEINYIIKKLEKIYYF